MNKTNQKQSGIFRFMVCLLLISFSHTGLADIETREAWPTQEEAGRHALNDAWGSTIDYYYDNGTTVEYGGWVYEANDGGYGYTVPIPGETDGVELGGMVEPRDGGGFQLTTGQRVVATYHVHPPDHRGPDGEYWDNEHFSPADKDLAHDYGVPTYLRTPAERYLVYDPDTNQRSDPPREWGSLPELPPDRRPSGGCGCSVVGGEPHITTHDRLYFDFHAAGEFIAVQSDDLIIMVRFEPWAGFKSVSILTAVAISTGGQRIAVYRKTPHVRIDGVIATDLNVGKKLKNNVYIKQNKGDVYITAANGDEIKILSLGRAWLDMVIQLSESRRNQVSGLLGNFDGKRDNEFKTRAGQVVDLTHLSKEVYRERFYRLWGDSWRISAEESLFDYFEGKAADEYQLSDFPEVILSYKDVLSREGAAAAREACLSSGVSDPKLLQRCVYDIVLTNDKGFSESYSTIQGEETRMAATKQPSVATTTFEFDAAAGAKATLSLLDSAQYTDTGILRLTPAELFQRGGAFYAQSIAVNHGFVSEFSFSMKEQGGISDSSGKPGADGIAFVLTDKLPEHLKPPGVGLGYVGLENFIAIELDTYHNAHDPSPMHLSIQRPVAGAEPYDDQKVSLAGALLSELDDGKVHTLKLDVSSDKILIYLDDKPQPILSKSIALKNHLDLEKKIWVGLTAATGSSYQVHNVHAWRFRSK